ncbi:hypothetical protein WJX75_004177 [Coccomyxa subellipsoidea]|uniref:Uncharacterized protein n=1 Tax=Coccomyxa subellipsoidea TaxID=248742 RepID=A0ABR2Z3S9_9CHLO
MVNTRKYKYFFFMNSSVRGPFLPSYHEASVHWTTLYTQRLNNDVKLVGSTINCQPIFWLSDTANEMRHNPHVQSYVVATDKVGLQILRDDGTIFKCYESLQDVVWYSEVGASRAILEAGYTIDALMMKYTGVDWRNKGNWNCNDRQNPYDDFAYDGLMINPLEVLFVKMKSYQLESDWITSKMVATYERWQRNQGQESSDATWQHFINQGQFEGRPFRFICENEYVHPAPEYINTKGRFLLSRQRRLQQ